MATSPPRILGLHHVTATVDAAQDDLDFAAGAIGLRLVKKTVNFDNHHVYHFYYGDRVGTPGTLWTTFPYKGHGVPIGQHGAGQIVATAFSVPAGSLDFWRDRLRECRLRVQDGPSRFDEEAIQVVDPSGLVIELIATPSDARTPWTGYVDAEVAVRGLHSVTLNIPQPDDTIEFMTTVLGFSVAKEMTNRTRLTVNGSEPGKAMEIVHGKQTVHGMNGLGTVHHVAMAIATPEEQLRIRAELLELGVKVTPVRDRQYFQSIYFREPGGVLFEIATLRPGFPVDEPVDQLGQALKLPPWEEPNRREIESGLASIEVPASRA
ncbi:MAG TPA: ring-cleaving dioxygenase [Vicinamibacterales bacterium]|jgi:glyoxalase family protein|nr:ring-cleaving dioxygenase [Vicinamibacterales bacterium]